MDLDEFFKTFGHDIEMRERRQVAQVRQKLERWYASALELLCGQCDEAEEHAGSMDPLDETISAAARRAAVYHMLSGAVDGRWNYTVDSRTGVCTPRVTFYPYPELLRRLLAARPVPCTWEQAAQSVRSRSPLFRSEGVLEEHVCGTFWGRLIGVLPPWSEERERPADLDGLLDAMAACHAVFSGGGDQEAVRQRLEDAFFHHWRAHSPTRAQAEDAVRRWDFSRCPRAMADLLLLAFPQAARRWDTDQLAEWTVWDLLCEVWRDGEQETALEMWRLLLDTAGARLGEPQAAEELLNGPLESGLWFDGEGLEPLAEALKGDESFARQVFQSAFVGDLQENLLRTCADLGELELGRHLLDLLSQNPFPHNSITVPDELEDPPEEDEEE